MCVFFCKKIKNLWWLGALLSYPFQPPAAGGFAPRPLVVPPPLPNPECAIGQAYEVLPLAKFLAGYATAGYQNIFALSDTTIVIALTAGTGMSFFDKKVC